VSHAHTFGSFAIFAHPLRFVAARFARAFWTPGSVIRTSRNRIEKPSAWRSRLDCRSQALNQRSFIEWFTQEADRSAISRTVPEPFIRKGGD
jgi:hypothetical protein